MKVAVFSIPALEPDEAVGQANTFLAQHRILDVDWKFHSLKDDPYWCLFVRYLDSVDATRSGMKDKEKIDYKNLLDPESFKRFCQLRRIRKAISETEAVPAFAVFTDKQMAEFAKFETLTLDEMKKIEGFGEGKLDRFGEMILAMINKTTFLPDEKSHEKNIEPFG